MADVSQGASKQKRGRTTAADGLRLDVLLYGGYRIHLYLYLCFLCYWRFRVVVFLKSFIRLFTPTWFSFVHHETLITTG